MTRKCLKFQVSPNPDACVCVYHCSTYYKAVHRVAWGEGDDDHSFIVLIVEDMCYERRRAEALVDFSSRTSERGGEGDCVRGARGGGRRRGAREGACPGAACQARARALYLSLRVSVRLSLSQALSLLVPARGPPPRLSSARCCCLLLQYLIQSCARGEEDSGGHVL